MKEKDLADEVEKLLVEGNWFYDREPVLGKARPDFVINMPNGNHVVVEVKAWDSNVENWSRALHQARLYKQLSKAAGALVVLPKGESVISGSEGVVPLDDLVRHLTHLRISLPKARRHGTSIKLRKNRTVFASMPFAGKYDDTFLVAISPAALERGAIAQRVDHNGTAGDIVAEIERMIREAEVVVADLSESRPNVLHETGFAQALKKTVVQICSTPTTDLPFNVRNNRTIEYSIGQTARLKSGLVRELKKFL